MILICSLLIAARTTDYSGATTPYELKYPSNFGGRFTIPEDNPTTVEGVRLGRMLFYEERLSANNKVSCASCHQQKLAFTDGLKTSFGVDGTNTRRNSMSIANLLWVREFFWDGRSESLEAQAAFPLTDPHEMGQALETSARKLQSDKKYRAMFRDAFDTDKITPANIQKAIAQFERTLISSNSNYDKYLVGQYKFSESEANGFKLFSLSPDPARGIRGANCAVCHGGTKTFIEQYHNNGLSHDTDKGRADISGLENDQGRFRSATLRNIALTGPYMHDGRFKTLRDVLDHYSDHLEDSELLSMHLKGVSNVEGQTGLRLTDKEKDDIISFLNLLTDETFTNNPDFSDPELSANSKNK